VTAADALKMAGLLLLAVLLQVAWATQIEVASGHPDLAVTTLVALALLRGPLVGAVAGFWAGLVLDVATLGTLGLSSLLLTPTGYWAGRFGEATTRSSPYPPLVAVALATLWLAVGSAAVHFMLGESVPASRVFGAVLVPTLALNLLLAYPVYRLCRRVFPAGVRARREAAALV
jgi:rod shape-determining protein MreD